MYFALNHLLVPKSESPTKQHGAGISSKYEKSQKSRSFRTMTEVDNEDGEGRRSSFVSITSDIRCSPLLRRQIEVFEATEDDISRLELARSSSGRQLNKPIQLKQVGIRCRHCANVPYVMRQRGSTAFPRSIFGIYQASQAMRNDHFFNGECKYLPDSIREELAFLPLPRESDGWAGRSYWAESALELELVDTEDGICFATWHGSECEANPQD